MTSSDWRDITTDDKDGRQYLICTEMGTLHIAWWNGVHWCYGGGHYGNEDLVFKCQDLPPAVRKK